MKPGSPVPRAFSALGSGNCLVRHVMSWMWPSRATMWCSWHGLEPQRQGTSVKELGHSGHRLRVLWFWCWRETAIKEQDEFHPQCLVSYLSVRYPSAMMLCTMLRCKPGGLFRPEPSQTLSLQNCMPNQSTFITALPWGVVFQEHKIDQ